MRLGVQKGYSVTYKVLASQGDYQFPAVNDTIRFEVLDISAILLYDKANQVVLNYEKALSEVSLNGGTLLAYYTVQHALDSIRYGSIEVFLEATSFPFYPVSSQFWRVMTDYCPGLKVSQEIGALVVIDEVFYHYSYTMNSTQLEGYMYAYLRIDIDVRNGVMVRCELRCEETFNSRNYKDTSILIAFVGETLADEDVNSWVLPYVLMPMAVGVPLLLVVPKIYLPRRRRRARGTRKSEILSRLDDMTLLKLAEKVPGASVNRRAGRRTLTNVIGEFLSIQEIREELKEL
jgi:hypothetical protein